MSRKPSITIWPAIVAVTVEFEPAAEQRDAEQDRRDRGAEQRRSSSWARPSSRPRSGRCAWKVAAARIRIEALMVRANISASVESMVANFSASRFSGARVADRRGSARCRSAGRGCAASPSRRGCRSPDRACRVGDDLGRRREAADHPAPVRVGEGDLEAKQTAMTPISVMMKASIQRKPGSAARAPGRRRAR